MSIADVVVNPPWPETRRPACTVGCRTLWSSRRLAKRRCIQLPQHIFSTPLKQRPTSTNTGSVDGCHHWLWTLEGENKGRAADQHTLTLIQTLWKMCKCADFHLETVEFKLLKGLWSLETLHVWTQGHFMFYVLFQTYFNEQQVKGTNFLYFLASVSLITKFSPFSYDSRC